MSTCECEQDHRGSIRRVTHRRVTFLHPACVPKSLKVEHELALGSPLVTHGSPVAPLARTGPRRTRPDRLGDAGRGAPLATWPGSPHSKHYL